MRSVRKNKNEIIPPITTAVNGVIFGGISISFSSLYGEMYFLYFTKIRTIAVIITVEMIHHKMNKKPCSS